MASDSSTLSAIRSKREDFVDKARTEWIKRLIDTSRRNNLLYFRETKNIVDLSSSLSFSINDIKDTCGISLKLLNPDNAISRYISENLSIYARNQLNSLDNANNQQESLCEIIIKEFNRMIMTTNFFNDDQLKNLPFISYEINQLIKNFRNDEKENVLLNKLIFERIFLEELEKCAFSTTPSGIIALINQERASIRSLLPKSDEIVIESRINNIRRHALENLEEKGLETLFIALGMASWDTNDGGRAPRSPVILIPVAIDVKARGSILYCTGEPQINLVFTTFLEMEYNFKFDIDYLMEKLNSEGAPFDPLSVFENIKNMASEVKGLAIYPCFAFLGNFMYQKMAMVKDLREHVTEMAANDVIAAIAGDPKASEIIRCSQIEIDDKELDQILPKNDFLILDADSSQQKVILSVLNRKHCVVQGPPGTGKSQTIANLIVALVAQGRRVLFVAEKRAALEVVGHRLEKAGLGHLVLDLHGADKSRREIMGRVKTCLALIKNAESINVSELHKMFQDRRTQLNDHAIKLHKICAPSNRTLFELQALILKLRKEVKSNVRWRGASLDQLNEENARIIIDLLNELSGLSDLLMNRNTSPWMGANLPDGNSVQEATDAVSRLSSECCPKFCNSLESFTSSIGVQNPATLTGSKELAEKFSLLFKDIGRTLAAYPSDIFNKDLEALENDLSPAGRGILSRGLAKFTDNKYKTTLQAMKELRLDKNASHEQIYAEVKAARDQLLRWNAVVPDQVPCLFPVFDELKNWYKQLESELSILKKYILNINFDNLELVQLKNIIKDLSCDTDTPYRIRRMIEVETEIDQRGAAEILKEIKSKDIDPELWSHLFEYAWFSSCLDKARSEDSSLAGFNGRVHERFVKEFCELDKKRLELNVLRLKRLHAERVIDIMNRNRDQENLVRRESEKKTRHLQLRKLLALAPDVLTALFPCWMASPLSVSQLINADRQYFDVVIFDEASQVLPEDAVGSILRASQVVVAGDSHQLPPTTFFMSGDDESNDWNSSEETTGFESILDLLSYIVRPIMLEWHYRSRDESLIAFSNHHIYGDRMITFPGPGGSASISHILVSENSYRDGQEESSSEEVKRVVEIVFECMRRWPDETLGVITMGMHHAERVQAAIDRNLQKHPELEMFFDSSRDERFFVKNIERVQGDERDIIILSVGYGKDRSGKLPYRFGPLNQNGGERRLNVAITRARCRMILVSSFSHLDMDPNRSNKRGVQLLRSYIEFASSKGAILGDNCHSMESQNPFEADVFDAITSRGVPMLSQYGVSGYRIDFVAQHPQQPGRFVLAIETDGKTYHSSKTARDRDRLRQQHLEALGWRFHRIWSTDWFMEREKEIERALIAYREAVAKADEVTQKATQVNQYEENNGTSSYENLSKPLQPLPQTDIPTVIYDDPENGLKTTDGNLDHLDNNFDSLVHSNEIKQTNLMPYPNIIPGKNIKEYSESELDLVVMRIKEDGKLRSDEELLEEIMKYLGFRKKGKLIRSALNSAISRSR